MENFLRDRVDRDFRRLTQAHIYDVGFIYLNLGCDDRHIGERHQGAAECVLDADDHGLPFTDRQVGDYAIIRSGVGGLLQHVSDAGESGASLAHVTVGGIVLGFRLGETRLSLSESCVRGGPRIPAAVEIRLCDQTFLE